MKAVHDVRGLVLLLNHRNPDIQYEAEEALGEIGDVDPLAALLEGEPISGVRWKASESLARIGSPAVESLVTTLSHPDEDVRAEAAASMAAIGKPSIAPLIHFLKYSQGPVRIEVMNALGDLHANDAIEPLVQMLGKADEQERCAIASTLDAILTPSVEQLAKRLWNGSDPVDSITRKEQNQQKINGGKGSGDRN